MFKIFAKLPRFAVLISIVGLTALAAWASTAVNVTASLTSKTDTTTWCLNCQTNTGGFTIFNYYLSGSRPYSLVGDDHGAYSPSTVVQSQILTNNSVYTFDTSATLDGGYVGSNTRTVQMHFFSPVECWLNANGDCPYPNNILPPCWGSGAYDQNQAVNWSVFAPVSFVKMKASTPYQGRARLNFNVRNAACDGQINRFRLDWGAACIVKSATGWTVTSDVCGAQTNYGEAHLQAYGGTGGNTVDYGDWRMPFVLTLTK